MITNLKILNGDISLEFDPLNTIYTVKTSEDFLNFKYDLAMDVNISVFGNEFLKNGENTVVLTAFNDTEMVSYYFYVYKEEMVASTIDNNTSLLDFISTKKETPAYLGPTIGVICFLSILILFVILFKKDKKC